MIEEQTVRSVMPEFEPHNEAVVHFVLYGGGPFPNLLSRAGRITLRMVEELRASRNREQLRQLITRRAGESVPFP